MAQPNSLFEVRAKSGYNLLRKEHKVIEFDVWIAEDKHIVPKEIEYKMYALGFEQRRLICKETISPVQGIDKVEYVYYVGIFDCKEFEVSFTLIKKDKWKMMIFPQGSQLTIDEGKHYDEITGMQRLKELRAC